MNFQVKDGKSAQNSVAHYLALGVIVGLGALFRFWHLDTKPLWLDEVLTAIFATGHRYNDVPVQELISFAALTQFFTVQPGGSCPQIAQTVATESVHPPLFFCLMYGWMNGLHPTGDRWLWTLRAFPALLGTGAIAAGYWLNRLAFSPSVGLMTAALMAVSPFAVYLSQEARHYTLPMLLILLALVALVQLQHDLSRQRWRPLVWLGWMAINILSLYTHYFCLLSLVAQVVALGGWMLWQQRSQKRGWVALGMAVGGIALSYLPWLMTFLAHLSRPETDWLEFRGLEWTERIAPIYQTLIGWVVMAIALPVEDQPTEVALPAALLMVGFAIWLSWQAVQGWRQVWQHPSWRSPLVLLMGFTLTVVIQFFLIVYGLGKDITVVPRYNFVYYPGMVALLGVGLMGSKQGVQTPNSKLQTLKLNPLNRAIALLMGVISSVFVVYGFAFQKSYNPAKVVEDLLVEPSLPLIVVTHYRSLQEIALGLSFALELRQYYPEGDERAPVRFAFIDRRQGDWQAWRSLSRLDQPLPVPLNLWVVVPEIRKRDYPKRLKLSKPRSAQAKASCGIDYEEFHRLGFPYQLYRCQ